jgi:hypothetical protein
MPIFGLAVFISTQPRGKSTHNHVANNTTAAHVSDGSSLRQKVPRLPFRHKSAHLPAIIASSCLWRTSSAEGWETGNVSSPFDF